MSDLHIDVGHNTRPFAMPDPRPDHDVVVIAGDIREDMKKGVTWIANNGFTKPVIYVGGNHEFYRSSRDRGLEKAQAEAAKHPNIHILQDSCVDIGGVRFIGATLWTDYKLMRADNQQLAMLTAESNMNDHRLIRFARGNYRPWLAKDCLAEHEQSRRYIDLMLGEPFDGPRVVVTHHAPAMKSIDPRFWGDLLNAAFASHLDELIDRADLWIHGHVHHAHDYRMGDGRVVCNPRGYVGFGEQSGFDPSLVIELSERQGSLRPPHQPLSVVTR